MNAFVIGLVLTAAPGVAYAAPNPDAVTPMFGLSPIGDDALAGVCGQGGVSALSVAAMKRIVDDNGRADLRQTGSVGRIQMDVWWGTVGSELIAQSVRTGEPR